jgi:hypothetical protein
MCFLGMHVKSTPNAITGLTDSYTDWAADFEYDRTIPQFKNDVLSVQYTGYLRFNGAQMNYDGAGRDASSNNTVFLLARFVF